MSILLSINEPWHYRNWEPVIRHLPAKEVQIHVSPWRWHLPDDAQIHRQHVNDTLKWLTARGVAASTGRLAVEPNVYATLGIEPRLVGQEYTRQVRMLYAVISKQYTYSDKNLPYDEVLVASEFGRELMNRRGVNARVVGYPKLDDFFRGRVTKESARRALGIGSDETVILYAPTLGELCTYELYAAALAELGAMGKVLTQLHPVSYLKERARFAELEPCGRLIAPVTAGIDTLVAADVILTDYSGVMFEACAIDTPVVLLDQPGLEMTDCVERVHRDAGIRVENAADLVDAVRRALDEPQHLADRREYYRNTFYAHHGEAGRHAAEALEAHAERSRQARMRDVDLIYTRLRRHELGVAP